MLQGDSFESLAILRLSSPSHVLQSSCSPDKDLLLVISRLGNKDTISLWKMQGGKKWEVDVSVGNVAHEEVTGIAWSPDGMSILISHHPPRLSIHSIQDGRRERSVSFSPSSSSTFPNFRITNVWWIKFNPPSKKGPEIPDFFKRNKTIPGSALSQLKMQPLLDPLKDDTSPITTSDLFSFQGILPTSSTKVPKLPDSIADWPTLPPDLVASSIKPYPRPGDPKRRPGLPEEVLDDVRVEASMNYDSIVVVADDHGQCHFFLDATYPLGSQSVAEVENGVSAQVSSLTPSPVKQSIFCHVSYHIEDKVMTTIVPSVLDLTLLRSSQIREVARASSAARDLAWYMLRVMEEMRTTWIGEQGDGAHAIGPKWIKEIETRQSMHVAGKPPNAICDLTSLLVGGRPTDALNDVFGNSSERGILKWETSMTEALTKLRDFSEKRLVLAAQRLYIIMREVKGWCKLPQKYGMYQFDEKLVDSVTDWLRKAIVLSTWMASMAREQLYQFREFKIWLRYEINKANNDGTEDFRIRALSWDVLEVNRYLMNGVNGSGLEDFFDQGGKSRIPTVTPYDVRAPAMPATLEDAIKAARLVLDKPFPRPWEEAPQLKDISKIDRNLEGLVNEIARICQRIFAPAGLGAGQYVTIDRPTKQPTKVESNGKEARDYKFRERTTIQDGVATQFVLSLNSHGEGTHQRLCLLRLQYDTNSDLKIQKRAVKLDVATIACDGDGEGNPPIEIMDFDFFDDKYVVLVIKSESGGQEASAHLGMMSYQDLKYSRTIDAGPNPQIVWRENLIHNVMSHQQNETENDNSLRLLGTRKLGLRSVEQVMMTVNGRPGRQTVCVLDGRGMEMEVVDMAEEDEEVDEEQEDGEGGGDEEEEGDMRE